MRTVVNLADKLRYLTFIQYETQWHFDKRPFGNHKHQYYIIDKHGYRPVGYPNVFGLTIDFSTKELILHIIQKDTGWNPKHSYLIASDTVSLAKFDYVMRTPDRFIARIKEIMDTPTITEQIAR